MRQIWIKKIGPPEVLQIREAPLPVPANGEVRIRVEAAGINFADIMGRMGLYRDAPGVPYVPGYEVSGTIDAISQGVTGFKEGDRVLAVSRFGGYSDIVCVPYQQVFKRLEWMNALDGAALPVNYLTAYIALVVIGSVHPGNRVLIHNSAGGVGLAALEISKIIGAKTYGTASPSKHEKLQKMGLDYPIDYRNMDYERVIMNLTKERGVDIILDPLGGTNWKKNYRLLAPTGRLVHYGASSMVSGKKRSLYRVLREITTLPYYTPFRLMQDNKSIAGINLAHLWDHVDLVRVWMNQIISWYDEVLFRPTIDKTFPFTKAAEAHHYLQDRQNFGKVLLTP
jgi:NADPH:quinone reductase-like Zn-dependent oxidoreductase